LSRAIVIWAKAPIPGFVKTRLCPPLTYEQAAGLQQAMTLDKVRQALIIAEATVYVASYPPEGLTSLMLPEQVTRMPQEGDSLEERLCNCLATMRRAGHRHIILSDSDSPTLPSKAFAEAFRALEDGNDICICPAEDGGYCFIALAKSQPEILIDVPWSTNHVVRHTICRSMELGLRTSVLHPGFDVDDASSLARLAHALQDRETQRIASATYGWVRSNLSPQLVVVPSAPSLPNLVPVTQI
jgi:uncharacterized protein